MNLSQRHLRMFVTTVAVGNISRASELLHITQPALSRALAEFEAQLGATLLARTTRRLALTAEGERFLPVAQRLLRDMDGALADMRAARTGLSGTVVLAVGSAFGSALLPAAVHAFAAGHPGVQLRVIDDNSAGITARVASGEADIGIGSPVGDTSRLVLQPLLSARLGLLGDARRFGLGRSVSAARAAGLPLLKEPADTSILHLLRTHGSELVAQMHGGVEVSSLTLQLALARAGVGVAVLSALGAAHPAAVGLRFVPLRPALRRELFLIEPRHRARPPAVQAFRQALVDAVRGARLPAGVQGLPA